MVSCGFTMGTLVISPITCENLLRASRVLVQTISPLEGLIIAKG